MSDLFQHKAQGWDQRPGPQRNARCLADAVRTHLHPDLVIMDFGAGTGLVSAQIAPLVREVLAVDVSSAMLEQLSSRRDVEGKVTIVQHDLVQGALPTRVGLIVSAMALHHVEDTSALLRSFYEQLEPGGRVAIADIDREDGSFHGPGTPGVHHLGFERAPLIARFQQAGFSDVRIETLCEIPKNERIYTLFLLSAQKPA